jgi:polar amino acid transport system ATP-binding protein
MAILQVNDIHKCFDGTEVLKGVSFELESGNALAIIGSSGSGKTTLLRCINFLEKPTSGSIVLKGESLFDSSAADDWEQDLRRKRLHFGMVFQNFNLFPQYTALENVMLAPDLLAKKEPDYRSKKALIRENAEELLDRMGLKERMSHYPHQLSGGQQQRVAIARALCMKPDIMLFDEPTSALDPELTGEVLKTMRELADEHMTMIVVTHEMNFAREAASRVVFVEGGVIVEQGPARQVIDNPQEERTQAFLKNML